MDAPFGMRAFVSVVDHQSFSGAADALRFTPSAVSKLVTKLEARLGVRLLNRTTRRLALTSEGEVYFARARRIVADIQDAEAEVAKSRGSPRGHLHVNTNSGFGVHQLAPALPDFLLRYPDIEIELSITDRIVDLIAGQADMTIRAGRIADTSLTARKIADFKRTICAAPSYLATFRGCLLRIQAVCFHTAWIMGCLRDDESFFCEKVVPRGLSLFDVDLKKSAQ
jgi:DNA-binding transcriptional LysR family regulator